MRNTNSLLKDDISPHKTQIQLDAYSKLRENGAEKKHSALKQA